MKKKIGAALLGAAATALISCPSASADTQDFLNDLYAHGWYSHGGDASLVRGGYIVCQMMAQGYNGVYAAESVYRNTGADVTADDAAEFVIFAVEDLCPQYDHRGTAA
jgi:hypothetical protein